ncbi:MAG: hypothetical protein ACE5JH_05500 [Acidobacteriota bacterium]
MIGRGPGRRRLATLLPALLGAAIAASVPRAAPGSGGERPAAGAPRLEAEADRTAITLGDPIAVTLRLVYPEGWRIVSFEPERSLGSLVLLDRREEPTRRTEDGMLMDVLVLRVTAFEVGEGAIPRFEVSYVDPEGLEVTARSEPIPFAVVSVLSEGDTEPADIKGPVAMPESPLWPWLLLGATALAAALYAWRRRRRRRATAAATPPAPPRPPHETAYADLQRLLSSDLLARGRVKEFYIELSEILRRYVGARFRIETFERTTSEILEGLREVRAGAGAITSSREFFGTCDLVKFAKYVPASEQTRAHVERAYRLVDETRPPAPAAATQEPAA